MDKVSRILAVPAILALALTSTAAIAGTPIEGVGGSRAAAMAHANEQARYESQRRHGQGNCYTPALVSSCRENSGEWICVAYVANHRGSCRG